VALFARSCFQGFDIIAASTIDHNRNTDPNPTLILLTVLTLIINPNFSLLLLKHYAFRKRRQIVRMLMTAYLLDADSADALLGYTVSRSVLRGSSDQARRLPR